MKMSVDRPEALVQRRQMTLEEVKKLTPARLKRNGFCLSEETIGDGNCFINGILNQMR